MAEQGSVVSAHDEACLAEALALAASAQALASPNPTVGCVLTDAQGRTLGRGRHEYDHRDHAEIAALKQATAAGHNVHGSTAYVTLEPCSHHGRTGPCADALVAAGIRRCVVATADPNPLVHGMGLAKLAAAGVEVALLPGQHPAAIAARRLNDAFALSIQLRRPFVTLKSAISVDGMLAPPAHTRQRLAPVWLTSEAARADVQQLRHASDALLTGIGTVLADDPELTDRTGLPRRRTLLRAVADSHLRTPPAARIAQQPQSLLLLCGAAADFGLRREWEQRGAAIAPLEGLTPAAMLQVLYARDLRSVLLEAGSGLNAAFLAAGLVDRVVLYVSERELGSDAVPFRADGLSPFALLEQLTGTERQTFPNGTGEDVRLSGVLRDPWRL